MALAASNCSTAASESAARQNVYNRFMNPDQPGVIRKGRFKDPAAKRK